jgi:hypothetical protein
MNVYTVTVLFYNKYFIVLEVVPPFFDEAEWQ